MELEGVTSETENHVKKAVKRNIMSKVTEIKRKLQLASNHRH
jgi:hypothetical protein